ncbi:uncharacterized protein LOC126816912 [Patella vulgata]|uniref:uncharacterized protein LOC126816912 n=1 Tax=Patella vulgata TaxID=6465 RepID=UPI00217F664F|nr:uncharacterized protein LOC126816912 [Patella vulgata]
MVAEWGEDFRKAFKRLSEITSLYTDAAHLVVTATLTNSGITSITNDLQLITPTVVKMNPDRQNIFIEKKLTLPNLRKYEKFDDLIQPISAELKQLKSEFPVTIVYVDSLECLYYCYNFTEKFVGKSGYVGIEQTPENRIFAQYHSKYTPKMKTLIVNEICKDNPTLRLVLATVSLGMGLNAPSVSRIIHFRPSTSLESYSQEIGRAGRNGQPSQAIIYYNNNDIAANRPGITKEMILFCKDETTCLRKRLLDHFGSEYTFSGGPSLCCSNCRNSIMDNSN